VLEICSLKLGKSTSLWRSKAIKEKWKCKNFPLLAFEAVLKYGLPCNPHFKTAHYRKPKCVYLFFRFLAEFSGFGDILKNSIRAFVR